MQVLIFVVLLIVVGLLIAILWLAQKSKNSSENSPIVEKIDAFKNDFSLSQSTLRQEISNSVQDQIKLLSELLSQNQRISADSQKNSLENLDKSFKEKQDLLTQSLNSQMKILHEGFTSLQNSSEQKLDLMRKAVSESLKEIQNSNEKKLSDIQITVDEKLQKSLDEKFAASFKQVSERLEQVHKGLGEMQTIASSVGDLKKVLSNVKTRGNLGEIQLANIFAEIMIPSQYETQFRLNPKSGEKVDFAVKLPGENSDTPVYLPIDSKFPGDTYGALQDAYDSGEKEKIDLAWKALETTLKNEAKSINAKYICPPYTTNFAIMFLPFEGLYAEVARRNLVEVFQREYKVNIAGPSTMAALLNSLQLGFKTLQIQKRSSEVWQVLSAVKTEFGKFGKVFENAQKRIEALGKDMDTLVGTRTRAIQRTLKNVEMLDKSASDQILEIEDFSE